MEQEPSKKCHLCNNTRGLYFCYECKHVLCQECRLKHDRIPATKNHTIVPADRVDLLAYTSKSECTTHDQEYSLLCSTCKTLTCNQCVTSTHKHHSFVDISAVSSEARKHTQDYLLQIKGTISSLSNMIKRVEYGDMMALDEESNNELFQIQCLTEKLWEKDVEEQMDIKKTP